MNYMFLFLIISMATLMSLNANPRLYLVQTADVYDKNLTNTYTKKSDIETGKRSGISIKTVYNSNYITTEKERRSEKASKDETSKPRGMMLGYPKLTENQIHRELAEYGKAKFSIDGAAESKECSPTLYCSNKFLDSLCKMKSDPTTCSVKRSIEGGDRGMVGKNYAGYCQIKYSGCKNEKDYLDYENFSYLDDPKNDAGSAEKEIGSSNNDNYDSVEGLDYDRSDEEDDHTSIDSGSSNEENSDSYERGAGSAEKEIGLSNEDNYDSYKAVDYDASEEGDDYDDSVGEDTTSNEEETGSPYENNSDSYEGDEYYDIYEGNDYNDPDSAMKSGAFKSKFEKKLVNISQMTDDEIHKNLGKEGKAIFKVVGPSESEKCSPAVYCSNKFLDSLCKVEKLSSCRVVSYLEGGDRGKFGKNYTGSCEVRYFSCINKD